MTDTDLITTTVIDTEATPAAKTASKRAGGLSGMVLTELRALAGDLGIKGTSGMRKGDLIAAIQARQSGSGSDPKTAPASQSAPTKTPREKSPGDKTPGDKTPGDKTPGEKTAIDKAAADATAQTPAAATTSPAEESAAAAPAAADKHVDATPPATSSPESARSDIRGERTGEEKSRPDAAPRGESADADARTDDGQRTRRRNGNREGNNSNREGNNGNRDGNANREGGGRTDNRDQQRGDNQGNRNDNRNQNDNRGDGNRGQNNNRNSGGNRNNNASGNGSGNNGPQSDNNNRDDEDGVGRGRRGRRFRERRRGRDRDGDNADPQVSDDDVLQPVAGILDVLDNYAFVRTSGYLAGPNDVYVSMNLVRKNGLRRGDALTGAVKLPRDGEQSNQRQKFNPLVRLDTVNGTDVDSARRRPEFTKLTPLYPNERLRLETRPEQLDTRVIDLVMPIGKGQRALIVSPPKAGKTTVLQDIANAIATNNPECHLMVVLVDERPEEVTDMQRSVKGEVIASTFDRPPSDHTSVAELAIERAKRLVEQGQDVVVLLDSITRLGRAYNNASPASGRILSGGVDSTALYPPKRFLGAARNIENGGSLTIIASALVETGSTGDTVIFEEFKGTGNAELKLDRKIAERRVFPAVDVNQSSTRKDELMMSAEEFGIMHKLRRVLSGLDSQQAIDLLISQLKKSKNNIEFLRQVQSNAPGAMVDD